MDYKFKTEPYAHQLHALGASHNKENYALFMEMGTGKSKVLVDNIAMLYDKGKINAALIIAPKGVYRNWERQEIPIHMPDHIVHNVVTWSPVTTKKQQKENLKLYTLANIIYLIVENISSIKDSAASPAILIFFISFTSNFINDCNSNPLGDIETFLFLSVLNKPF